MGLPTSRLSIAAISSAFSLMSWATRFRIRPRSRPLSPDQPPLSKASRAARTAASTSAAPASATVVTTWPVDGSITSVRAPSLASTHCPPMNSRPGSLSKVVVIAHSSALVQP